MRLTNAIKEAIVAHVLQDAFGDRKSQLIRRKVRFANDFWWELYNKHEKAMKSLPKAAFRYVSEINGYCGGKYFHSWSLSESGDVSLPEYHHDDRINKLATDHPLTREFEEIGRVSDKLDAERKELKQEINSILNACSTDKKLLAIWPEGEKWITAHCKPDFAPVPMVSVNRLNEKLCGLIGPASPTCPEQRKDAE